MDKLWVVAKREYLERVRSKWFVIMTLLVPVLMTGAILIPVYLSTRSVSSSRVSNIIILDATGAGLGERVAQNLKLDSLAAATGAAAPQIQTVNPRDLATAEESATRAVMVPDSVVGYLVLTDSTLAGKVARYAGRNASSATEMERLERAVTQGVTMVRLQREGVSTQTIDEIGRISLDLDSERISDEGRSGSGKTGFIIGIGIAILLFMSILVHGQNILRGVLEEKTTRVAEIVLSSVKPDTLLAGKVFGVGAVGLTQQLVWIGLTAYIAVQVVPLVMSKAGVSAAGSTPSVALGIASIPVGLIIGVLAFFLVGFVFYASLYAAAGAMVNSEQEAQQAAMPVMVLLMATWLLVQPVLLNPSSKLAITLSWLPFSSPIIMPMRMGLVSIPWTHVVGSLLVAVLGCVGAVWLAARIYRVGMLMYGKRPGIRELFRWIRYA